MEYKFVSRQIKNFSCKQIPVKETEMAKINNSGHKKATFKKMDQRKPTWKYFI